MSRFYVDDEARINELVDLVTRMRIAQKDYFRYRRDTDLDLSKRLESEVDKKLDLISCGQKELF